MPMVNFKLQTVALSDYHYDTDSHLLLVLLFQCLQFKFNDYIIIMIIIIMIYFYF